MKKMFLILLIITIFLLIGCGNKEENSNSKDKPNKEEKIETKITEDMNTKIDRFINELQLKYTNISLDELPENEKLYYAFRVASNGFREDYVLKEDIRKTMIELYGANIDYNDQDIKSIFTDETVAFFKNGKYVYNYDTAHGVIMVKGYTQEISRKRKNDVIEVKVKRVFINCGGDVCPVDALYKDPEYKEKIDVPKKYCDYDEYMPDFCDIDAEKYLKENIDEIPTLVFEFELENDNVIFKRLYKE